MIAFLNMFFSYLILVIIMAALAVCGVIAGKKLRDSKNAKLRTEALKEEEVKDAKKA
ncbi:MAG: hypothetical protein K6E98_03285 [Lachnospiraceae bacterium]|nr:hypothetical protein [Lachnospiraceae bacterium]